MQQWPLLGRRFWNLELAQISAVALVMSPLRRRKGGESDNVIATTIVFGVVKFHYKNDFEYPSSNYWETAWNVMTSSLHVWALIVKSAHVGPLLFGNMGTATSS